MKVVLSWLWRRDGDVRCGPGGCSALATSCPDARQVPQSMILAILTYTLTLPCLAVPLAVPLARRWPKQQTEAARARREHGTRHCFDSLWSAAAEQYSTFFLLLALTESACSLVTAPTAVECRALTDDWRRALVASAVRCCRRERALQG